MKIPVVIAASTLALGGVLPLAMHGIATADPVQRPSGASHRDAVARAARTRVPYRTSPNCTEDAAAGDYFIGVSSGSDVAGGEYAAVVSGSNNEACGENSAIASGQSNLIDNASASSESFVGAGLSNRISSTQTMIGAGYFNFAGGQDAFIGAGSANYAYGAGSFIGSGGSGFEYAQDGGAAGGSNITTGEDSFIGAGDLNNVSGAGSFIGSGGYLYATNASHPTTPGNEISGADSFIGAGDQNVVAANEAFVGAGLSNTIASTATYSSIVGGAKNTVSGEYASILGGYGNTASGTYGVVAGGNGNTAAGTLSFAAGYHADAAHNGSFVWSDYVSGSTPIKDSAANQFVIRASGGTYVFSNEASSAGEYLAPGSGTWSSLSDRNQKTAIVPLDDDAILAKVASLPIARWSYKSEGNVRHVGPMAQDFYAAFGTGTDDRHITSIDEDGVALAAIKALSAKLGHDNSRLHRENDRLQAKLTSDDERYAVRLAGLERQVDALAAHHGARR